MQQVGEAERLWFIGCDSQFREEHQTLACSGHEGGVPVGSHTLLNTGDEDEEKFCQHYQAFSPLYFIIILIVL